MLDFTPWPIIILDTETTGLTFHDYATVIEVGMVLLDCEGVEVTSFQSMVYPAGGLPLHEEGCQKAMEVNGIRASDLHGAPFAPEVWDQLHAWSLECERYIPGVTITAAPLSFDKPMMTKTFGELVTQTMPWADWCLMAKLRNARPKGKKRFKLCDLAVELGVGLAATGGVQTHRALDDARLEADLLRELVRCGGSL